MCIDPLYSGQELVHGSSRCRSPLDPPRSGFRRHSPTPQRVLPTMASRRDDIRNVAIIAHVDHGKTTLVDSLLKQSGQFRDSQLQGERILDSNDLERERGITILAKNIALPYKGTKINLIDTPGHADFGGEVERTLQMADGCLVLVDAFDGPMPQTKFVLRKAFAQGLRPIVIINKIDRPDARPQEVLDEIFDTFVELGGDEEQCDFPYLYASGRDGYASDDPSTRSGTIEPILKLIVDHVPGPEVALNEPFRIRCTSLDFSEYVGRIAVGRIHSGEVRQSMRIGLVKKDGVLTEHNVDRLLVFDNLGRVEVPEAKAGDIVAIVGVPEVDIGDTIAEAGVTDALPRIEVGEPTLSMLFTVNDSPLSGEGKFLTSRHLEERLRRELRANVALKVEPTEDRDSFRVSGRGLLHLAVLIETMRREGYELAVGKPEVILKRVDGQTMEPYEELVIDVPQAHVGTVIAQVTGRRAELQVQENKGVEVHCVFSIPARGLLGMRNRLLSATNGEASISHVFQEFRPLRGDVPGRANGVMISNVSGAANTYSMEALQQRGVMFVSPGDAVYEGMIVGENARSEDMVVNPTKEKKLSNVRSSGSDRALILKPPRQLSLELALEYIEADELVEVTPSSLRLRKKLLAEEQRKREARKSAGKAVKA